jgi:hypothetical protein
MTIFQNKHSSWQEILKMWKRTQANWQESN